MAMASERYGQQQQQQADYYTQPQQQSQTYGAAKAATAATVGGSLLLISGLTLAATVIGLAVVTPLFVIFSPILVPAVAAALLVSIGFLSSGAFGLAAVSVLSWMYQYMTGKNPPGAAQLEYAKGRIGTTAREVKDKAAEKFGSQRTAAA
ncbi:hypothetical protein DM860_016098 [Cuscuta australis]|uniref:Oleosin n=1 Tax=Cuscuta australis TaxID=267555 RepID=A0A328E6J4_9ASTE|nr:hypothetical protein DM860_016098 [Cuscuta australis]